MPEIIQIVGYKNSGKTTLAEFLVRYFTESGLKVGVIKHDGHDFEMDHPDTDTWKMSRAGAAAVAITSASKTAVLEEKGSTLTELISRIGSVDLILVEGFKRETYPKIVMLRSSEDLTLIQESSEIKAVVCWEALDGQIDGDFVYKEAEDTAILPIHPNSKEAERFHCFKLGENRQIAEWLREAFACWRLEK